MEPSPQPSPKGEGDFAPPPLGGGGGEGQVLRILHTESSMGWGGQEIRVLTEARGVARRGHEVVVAAPAESNIYRAAVKNRIEAIALPIGRKSMVGLFAMRLYLGGRRFDIVNTHSSTDSWLAAIACKTLRGAPAIVRTRHISAPTPRNAATRWLYTRAARRIATTGEKLRLQVIEEAGVDPARIISVPTGIDLETFQPGDRALAREELNLPLDAQVIGIVATLRSWKGHRYLFEAFANLEGETDAIVVVVGDGPQREGLELLATNLGIGSRVRFVGNQVDVAPWLRALDLFVLPSFANEGVPQALMQAMACGLAVVTTPVGSITEIVTDDETGVIVPPKDAPALGAAIVSLLHDGARRERLGTRARAVALDRFGESLMVDRMIELFEQARRG
jgi:glycosyltransferase involved in cell wall biosynthesis